MSNTVEPQYHWTQDQMIEVFLNEPDDFLKSERPNTYWCSE